MTALLAFSLLVLAWWLLAVLLDRTDRTVTDSIAHGAAVLTALAITLADLIHMRGTR